MAVTGTEPAPPPVRHSGPPPPRRRQEEWVLEEPANTDAPSASTIGYLEGAPHRRAAPRPETVRAERSAAKSRGTSRQRRATEEVTLPRDVTEELATAVGRERARDLADMMALATRAYDRDRYPEALRITRVLVEVVPESAAARELHGLVCYRLGRWREAARHLVAARTLSGDDPSQLPVIMDCCRAQGQHRKVEALWEELRSFSPPADVLSEGRLVLAAYRADRGELDSAIDLLVSAGAGRNLRRPADRHLRQWYVLADLYERAGDLPHARQLFARVAASDPDLADARQRLSELGAQAAPAPKAGRSGRSGS